MIRIPFGNERTARIEIRSVAPDANPYLLLFTTLKTGMEDKAPRTNSDKRQRASFARQHQVAIRIFRACDYVTKLIGESSKQKYLDYKRESAYRNPRELGTSIKGAEIVFHHEVTNQYLWNRF